MDTHLRTIFLENQWPKYPDARNLKLVGRLVQMDRQQLVLVKGTSKTKVSVGSIKRWSIWKCILVIGDIIGIKKNGECVLLAPNIEGSCLDFSVKIAQQEKWNHFLGAVQAFFQNRKFLEVSTPTLVTNPGPEASIDVFKTVYKSGRNIQDKYLITSPELHLKKIVSQTLLPVFEITKVFRNNEHSSKHQPEFWMLEWYRPFATLDDLAQDVRNLIFYLIRTLKIKNKKPRFEKTTFQKILKKFYEFEFTATTTSEQLKILLKNEGIHFSESLSLDDLFTLVNIELVETKLNPSRVIFLNDYPPYAAALAKLNKHGWAQRFEVYWQELELGNAFSELNDPNLQEQRFLEDNQKKHINGLEPLPIDIEFMKSLRRGLPPTAGISIGLERLYMALFQQKEIQNLKWFHQD